MQKKVKKREYQRNRYRSLLEEENKKEKEYRKNCQKFLPVTKKKKFNMVKNYYKKLKAKWVLIDVRDQKC